MSILKLYATATGTTYVSDNVDIQQDGRIYAIFGYVSMTVDSSPAAGDSFVGELSFLSTNTVNVHATRGSIVQLEALVQPGTGQQHAEARGGDGHAVQPRYPRGGGRTAVCLRPRRSVRHHRHHCVSRVHRRHSATPGRQAQVAAPPSTTTCSVVLHCQLPHVVA